MGKLTCSVCNTKVENDDINGFKYNRKSYCYPCFNASHKEDVVDKHMFYLRFMRLFGRNLSSAEWTQCERLVKGDKSDKWDWNKLEMVLSYVYEVECLEPNEESGCISILPFYEYKAEKFYDHYYQICDSVDATKDVEVEVVKVYSNQFTEPKPKVELKSVDELISWEEEDGEV